MTNKSKAETEDADEPCSSEQRLELASQRELDARALGHAHGDAQVVLEQTLQTFADLSDKAFRLVRLNGLVITILIAIASQVELKAYANIPSVASLLLFISSTLFAVLAYKIQTIDGGISTEAFQKLTAYKLREKEYLNWVLTLGYPLWITDGVRKSNQKEQWIRYSLLAFLGGIVMLLAGMLLSLY